MVRHEQGAAHAAQGYARVSGDVGVCLVTSGTGATNTVTGIADAMIDSTPIVVIAGQVGTGFLGTDAFQEVDLVGITQPITKWSYQIRRAEDVAWAVAIDPVLDEHKYIVPGLGDAGDLSFGEKL